MKIVNEFVNYKNSLNRKTAQEQYIKPIENFCEWLGQNGKKVTSQTLNAVSNQQAQNYVFYLKNDKQYANASIQKHVAILKSLYNYMLVKGDIGSNAFSTVEIPYDMGQRNRTKVRLSDDEISKLISQARNNSEKLQLALASEMGLRKKEVISLKVKDVNLDDMTLYFQRKGYGTLMAKLGIMKETRKYIKAQYDYAKSQGWEYLFESPVNKGKPVTEMAFTKLLNRCVERAGINGKHIYPHLLRSHAITNIYDKTDLVTASKFAGHSNVQVTLGYIGEIDLVEKLRNLE